MSIEAMKQALDAITNVLAGGDFDNPYADLKEAGAALRQAIEQAEKQEAVAFVSGYTNGECVVMPMNRATVFSVGTAFYTTPVHAIDMFEKHVHISDKHQHEEKNT